MLKLVIANWKMNPASYKEAQKLAGAAGQSVRKYRRVEVVVCPPFTWLTDMSHEKEYGLEYGAQDVFWMDKGAYTGEISPLILKNSKVKYVIIGHSERRKLGETNEDANRKLKAALANGLTAILCVGEDSKIHARGSAAVIKFIEKQLRECLKGLNSKSHPSTGKPNYIIVAYEPVWAISTNPGAKPDNPDQAERVILAIHKSLNSMFRAPHPMFRVLYGGSVNGANAEGFLNKPSIQGVLVGGASLKPREFEKIIKYADAVSVNKNKKVSRINK